MTKNMNCCVFTGRLGADPESRRVQGRDRDGLVTNIRIAVSESWKGRDGNREEKTEWINVVAFGHTADFLDQYARKGDLVSIMGKFRTRKWQDQNGNDKYTTEIVIDQFYGQAEILSSPDGGGRGDNRRDDRGRDSGRDDRDRGRDRDDRGRDDDRGGRDDRGRRDDRGSRDDRSRDRDDRSRDRDRDRQDDRRRDDRGGDNRGGGGSSSRERMDDDIPF